MSSALRCPECNATVVLSEQNRDPDATIRCPRCRAVVRRPEQSVPGAPGRPAEASPTAPSPISGGRVDRPADTRSPQEVARHRADNLNNQAVSLLNLGKPPAAEQLFERVLRIFPNHPEATYNRSLLHWRNGRLTDLGFLRQLEELRGAIPADWHPSFYMGLVHADRGDIPAAVAYLGKAAEQGGGQDAEVALRRIQPLLGQTAQCLQAFEGHTQPVTAVSLNADGGRALSGSADGTIRLWDLSTGACAIAVDTCSGGVHCVALLGDGGTAISGGGTVALWDLTNGQCLRAFEGHTQPVTSLSVNADGTLALTGGEDGTVRLWNVATGRCERTFEGHSAPLTCVSLSADGRFALSGSRDLELWLWDATTGSRMRAFEIQQSPPECASLSRDGRWVLSGDADAKLHLWNTKNGMRVRSLRGHTERVVSMSLSADGHWVLSGSLDRTLRLWDLTTGCCVRTLEGHQAGVLAVCLSGDGRTALSGGGDSSRPGDNTVRQWDLSVFYRPGGRYVAPPARCAVAAKEEAKPGQARFDGMLTQARTMAEAGRCEEAVYLIEQARKIPSFGLNAQALDLRSEVGRNGIAERYRDGRCTRMLRTPASAVGPVALSPDASHALSGGSDKMVRLWNLAKGESECMLGGHTGPINDLCYLPDGRSALSASEDGTVRVWDLMSATCTRTLEGHASWVSCVAVSPDGRWAVSGGRDKTLRLWDLANGVALRILEGHTNLVRSVRFSACGRWLLSGGFDKTLRLWDVAAGQCLRVFEGHTDIVHCVALNAERRFAVSAANDKMIRVWDLSSGRCVRSFQDHFERVLAVTETANGRWAVSGSGDKMLRLWNLVNGQCAQVLAGHTGVVTSLAMSHDGRWIVSGSHDQTIRIWELEWDYEFPAPSDWDDGATVYLDNFLTLHTPYASELPEGRLPTEQEVTQALTRKGIPRYGDEDFQKLIGTLRSVGYGWLRPEGVRQQLQELAAARGNDLA